MNPKKHFKMVKMVADTVCSISYILVCFASIMFEIYFTGIIKNVHSKFMGQIKLFRVKNKIFLYVLMEML